jgi:hypothetical protein
MPPAFAISGAGLELASAESLPEVVAAAAEIGAASCGEGFACEGDGFGVVVTAVATGSGITVPAADFLPKEYPKLKKRAQTITRPAKMPSSFAIPTLDSSSCACC